MSDLTTSTVEEAERAEQGRAAEEALAQDRRAGAGEGVGLVGPGGLLTGLTKTVLGTAEIVAADRSAAPHRPGASRNA